MTYTKQTVEYVMRYVFERCHRMREDGQKEYVHLEDRPFRNFETIAQEVETEPVKVLWTYARKHVDGIVAHIKGHRSQRENVRGRIYDLITFLVLLHAMEDEQDGVEYTLHPPSGEDDHLSYLLRIDSEGKSEQLILNLD